jgi:hypothetical protein
VKRRDCRDRIEKITYLGAFFFTHCKLSDEERKERKARERDCGCTDGARNIAV